MAGTRGCGFCGEEVETCATDVINSAACTHDFGLERTQKRRDRDEQKKYCFLSSFQAGYMFPW